MPFLHILCPIKHKSFATSVQASVEHKASLPNIIKYSYCPHCHTLHGWTPDEAFFDDVHEASRSKTGNGSGLVNESSHEPSARRKIAPK